MPPSVTSNLPVKYGCPSRSITSSDTVSDCRTRKKVVDTEKQLASIRFSRVVRDFTRCSHKQGVANFSADNMTVLAKGLYGKNVPFCSGL